MKTSFTTITLLLLICSQDSFTQTQIANKMHAFTIDISQESLEDLNQRIAATRWIDEFDDNAWNKGIDVKFLKELADYWKDDFEWKEHEAYLNSFKHYQMKVKDLKIHYVREESKGEDNIPILLLHGWASNFTEFLEVVKNLKEGNPNLDIIVPSLPGFAFSDTPESMSSVSIAEYLHYLMTENLGIQSYYIHGGDYGAFVAEKLAFMFPESVKGLHLADIPFYHFYEAHENLEESEMAFIETINNRSMMDGAYAMVHATKPKILSSGLNDSPIALAGWILQLYDTFGNDKISLFERFDRDDLLTNITLYWLTEKVYSSIRMYSEDMSGYDGIAISNLQTPVGLHLSAHDFAGIPPRTFVKRYYDNILLWKVNQESGHFAAYSHPEILSRELIQFIDTVEKVQDRH